jgi:hypothetical protein
VNAGKVEQEEMGKRIYSEINVLQNEYKKNKDQVIDFLIENVLVVDMTIPDVVKGKFTIG